VASVAHIVRRRRRRIARLRVRQQQRRFWLSLYSVLFILLIVLPSGVAFGGALVVYWNAAQDLASPQESLAALTAQGVTRFYDRDDTTLLYSLQDPLGDRRTWIPLDTLPPFVTQATLAAEDPDFLTAGGFDGIGTLLRLWQNILIGTAPPDGSITGRLVRNVIAPPPIYESSENDTRSREIALVAEINRRYSAQEILEWHLNTNYYGSEAYGIEAAAQIYLGKRSVDLTLAEAALLAAIPSAPQYNPFDDPHAASGRQQDVLRVLLNAGLISDTAFNEAAGTAITIQRRGQYVQQLAPDFTVYARRQAEAILNGLGLDGRQMVTRGGLRITTTLDTDLYLQSECALRAQMNRLDGNFTAITALDGSPCQSASLLPDTPEPVSAAPDEGSLIIIDARTGEIKSMVGAVSEMDAQPGPTLQPFVYLNAILEPQGNVVNRPSPASMLLDIPRSFPGAEEGLVYTVENPDGRYQGPVSLRQALGGGLFPPAAEVAYRQGMGRILNMTQRVGLNGLSGANYDLMLLERGGAVSLLDVAYSYSVFATLSNQVGVQVEPGERGYRGRDPAAIRRIEDLDGTILWAYDDEGAQTCASLEVCNPILETHIAYIINDMLADQDTRWSVLGQNTALDVSRPAAVVNGVTGDDTEDWTVGYTPQYVVGVHLGREDHTPMSLSPHGLEGAASVWHAVMEYTHTSEGIQPTAWQRPTMVVEAPVCDLSGLLPNGICPTHSEIFVDGTQPHQPDSYWQRVTVNSLTGQLATLNTPPELRSDQEFFVPPEEAIAWWRENNYPLPPVELDTISMPESIGAVRITQPGNLSYIGAVVDIFAQINTPNIRSFSLSYGQGWNPTAWIDLGEEQTAYDPNAALGSWDTTGLDGLYSLRLDVTRGDNSLLDGDAIQVTIDNISPTITLDSVEPGKIYRWPTDSEIQLEASVSDNIQTARVEFFHNGQSLGADESWPFQLLWDITGPGLEQFSATVYDAVGNSASAGVEVTILRSGA
jgi:membrane peptidoglycan carboxypeptidase